MTLFRGYRIKFGFGGMDLVRDAIGYCPIPVNDILLMYIAGSREER